jgi:hypothetical protein
MILLLVNYQKNYKLTEFHLPYKQTKEGIAQGYTNGKVFSIPDYTAISKRISKDLST